jgi:hypothetical protein
MTIFGTLSNRSSIDRSNIIPKIIDHDFDLIVYSSPYELDFIEIVKENYKKNQIAILYGGDKPKSLKDLGDPQKIGTLFIREMISGNAIPISYSIPKDKIVQSIPSNKSQYLAPLIPGDRSTYKYFDELTYYKQYQQSYFGLTMKKGGWDCLRHYEIIANGCLPFFKGFSQCPKYTMTHWPVALQREANSLYLSKNTDHYEKTLKEFLEYTKANLTTEKMAQYLLNRMQ